MFRSEGIVLSVQVIRDNHIRYVILTKEYGRITTWSKKKYTVDIGSILSILIERKGGYNTLHSLDTKTSLTHELRDYGEYHHFLSLLADIYHMISEGADYRGVYDDIIELIHTIKSDYSMNHTKVGNIQLFILIHIRIYKKLGILKKDAFDISELFRYIYDHIDTRTIFQISRGTTLTNICIENLRTILLQTQHSFLHGT